MSDKVKSLEKLRVRERPTKDKLTNWELDLQRHRDMLQGVLVRIRAVDDEIKDLRAQVAREQSDGDGENASVAAAPPTQVDSQQDNGAVSRSNGIWERRRRGVKKKGKL